MKKSQNNSKSLTLEKQNFLEEIKSVKNDLKVYESSCKNLKQCQLKLDSALKFLQDLLKVLKKDASKTLYTLIFKMIQKFQSNILSTNRNNPRKPLNIDDLNNSKISLKSEKNPSTKGKRSLSLSNKAQKTTKGTNIVNTSMFCLHKRTSSPMIKSQKILTRTENSSNKKKKTSKSRNPSPWKLSPKLSDRNSQCRDPGWANEKLCDIQNILKSGQESARNSFSKSKEKLNINHENSLIIASYCEKKKNDIKERIEK